MKCCEYGPWLVFYVYDVDVKMNFCLYFEQIAGEGFSCLIVCKENNNNNNLDLCQNGVSLKSNSKIQLISQTSFTLWPKNTN